MTDQNFFKQWNEININEPAPETEPSRQYYFMKKCKILLEEKTEELGRKLTCCAVTFGCQMNAKDSEKLLGILENIGFVATDSEDADFIIYNTCTVRENANLIQI